MMHDMAGKFKEITTASIITGAVTSVVSEEDNDDYNHLTIE